MTKIYEDGILHLTIIVKKLMFVQKGFDVMKENAIKKINKIGKAGYIISNIGKAVVGVGIVMVLTVLMVCLCMPKDFVKLKLDARAKMEVNLEKFGISFSEKDRQRITKELTEGTMTLDGEEYGIETLEVNETGFDMTACGTTREFTLKNLILPLILGIVYLAMTMVTLFFIGFLCKEIRDCVTPFADGVINKMKNLAISLVPWAVISGFTNTVSNSILSGKTQISYSVNLDMLMVILVIFALTYIFKYGAMLQQESDETL